MARSKTHNGYTAVQAGHSQAFMYALSACISIGCSPGAFDPTARCGHNNKVVCESVEAGFYLSKGEAKPCSDNCYSCSHDASCTGCMVGFYLSAAGSCVDCNAAGCEDSDRCWSESARFPVGTRGATSCRGPALYNCNSNQARSGRYTADWLYENICVACSALVDFSENISVIDGSCTECTTRASDCSTAVMCSSIDVGCNGDSPACLICTYSAPSDCYAASCAAGYHSYSAGSCTGKCDCAPVPPPFCFGMTLPRCNITTFIPLLIQRVSSLRQLVLALLLPSPCGPCSLNAPSRCLYIAPNRGLCHRVTTSLVQALTQCPAILTHSLVNAMARSQSGIQ